MGIDFKSILKQDEESLVIDKKKEAIKWLAVLSAVLVVALIVVIILKNLEDVDETRRMYVTKDIQNMRTYVENKANQAKADPNFVLPGISLDNQPITLSIHGLEEEYRYGYYFLNPEDYADTTAALLLPDEMYIVNYDTYDVINYNGIKFAGKTYYSLDDMVAIEAGLIIPSENTIIVRTAKDLELLHQYPNATFKLAANIDMAEYGVGEGWKPVAGFTGKFDGRGYTINNLKIYRPTESYIGLFADVKDTAQIVNVTFQNSQVTGENYTGILAGTMAGTVKNVICVEGTVTGVDKVGGLVGSLQQGSINNAKMQIGLVNGESQIGGLVGVLNSGTVHECLANVSQINGSDAIGGLVGSTSASATSYINECAVNFAEMSGTDDLGGLVGKIEILSANKLMVYDSYAVGNIAAGKTNMGGIVGYMRATNGAAVDLSDVYVAVTILNKVETAGGCVGFSSLAVTSPSKVKSVFWEKNLAVGEELESIGTSDTNNILNFNSVRADEMMVRSTFTDWDFDIWAIKEHQTRPYLKFEDSFKQYVQEIIEEKK